MEKLMRRTVNLFFSLAPAPLFVAGAVYSAVFGGVPVCGSGSWEMTAMWLIMAFAHTSPWLAWYQQRDLQRFQTLPDKQQ
jgi:hypothetical protein